MAPPRPEAERAFQMWSATTTQLVLDAIHSHPHEAQDAQFYLEHRKRAISESISRAIGLDARSESTHGITKQLDEILDLAFALDKDISQQVARVEWSYDYQLLKNTEFKFDPETMELDEGSPRSAEKVRLIVAPALVKRGRSTGEDFDVERVLLKSVVNCE
jgi:hypothetical protein